MYIITPSAIALFTWQCRHRGFPFWSCEHVSNTMVIPVIHVRSANSSSIIAFVNTQQNPVVLRQEGFENSKLSRKLLHGQVGVYTQGIPHMISLHLLVSNYHGNTNVTHEVTNYWKTALINTQIETSDIMARRPAHHLMEDIPMRWTSKLARRPTVHCCQHTTESSSI